MTSKNINIEISVYERLNRLKNKNESFSEVLIRLLSTSRPNPKQFFGILKREDLDYNEIKRGRRDRDVIL